MLEVATDEIRAPHLNHHGLVAATCLDLRIAERIDSFIGVHEKRQVSPGKSVVAMILNGLGFTNRRLYLTPQFFESKPVDLLLDAPIKAGDLNDYTLGHTLDEISRYGVSDLFAKVAFGIAIENNLLAGLNHLDTTSLSVSGEYENSENPESSAIRLTHGHSKDHRPDLKQAVLSLVVNGPSSIPIWMDPLNGNSSDKTSFHETIKKVQAFQSQISMDRDFKWVADSALYTTDKLLSNNDYLWLTRVPETVAEAKALSSKAETEIVWNMSEKGYRHSSFRSNHGDIDQRWLLVYSEQAYARESKTLQRNLGKKEAILKKELWHLENQVFGCVEDAEKEFNKLGKRNPLFTISGEIVPVWKYGSRGRPASGEKKVISGYKIETKMERNQETIDEILNRKGRFILATNDLDEASYSDEQMLNEYKQQQKVERGFRFLKDPWFMVDSIFLKSEHRIEALMMVMTLCLLVYNVAQYKLRQTLKENSDTLPNQLNKEIQNPTVRWIFQIMEGLGIVRFYDKDVKDPVRELVTGMTPLRRKIIQLWGATACRMYGIIPKSSVLPLGM